MIIEFAEAPPHPEFKPRLNSDLSPQAGQGGVWGSLCDLKRNHHAPKAI
jgi:hypothetical protein